MTFIQLYWALERLQLDLEENGLEGLAERLNDMKKILAGKAEEQEVERARNRVRGLVK